MGDVSNNKFPRHCLGFQSTPPCGGRQAHIALLTWWQAKVDGEVERYNNPRGEEYDVDVAKSKMGPTGICKLNYWPEYCRFESWDNPAEQIQPWKGAKNDE